MGSRGRRCWIAATGFMLLLQVSAHAAGRSLHERRTQAGPTTCLRLYDSMPSQPWNTARVVQGEQADSSAISQAFGARSSCSPLSLTQPSTPSTRSGLLGASIAEQVDEKKGFELYLDRKSLEIPNAKGYTKDRAIDDCNRYVRAMPKVLVNCYYNGVKLR